MLWFQGIRPHLTLNCPRRKKLLTPHGTSCAPEHDPYNLGACLSTLCTKTLATATIVPSLSETLPHADTCRTYRSMCRSKHNYSVESDGNAAWLLHASPQVPAGATPYDLRPQVATAEEATTSPMVTQPIHITGWTQTW